MAWKPREKQLSPEEAVALAKKELQPFWFGTVPLMAGSGSGDKVTAHPLDPTLTEKPWLILFMDPTTFSGESALAYFSEWSRRYATLGVQFLVILRFPHQELPSRLSIDEGFIQTHEISYPVAVDPDGLLSAAFSASPGPKLVLLDNTTIRISASGGKDWLSGIEAKLQKFLRLSEPGLPLQVAIPTENLVSDLPSIEFGKDKMKFEVCSSAPNSPEPGRIYLAGKWEHLDEKIVTKDQNASITFRSPAERVAVIARSAQQKNHDEAIMHVLVNGLPTFEEYFDRHLSQDDDGNASVSIEQRWFHQLLKGLPEKSRNVTLCFPTAHIYPIALFGLRFAQ